MKREPVTLKHVAARAHCSIGAASLVLNNAHGNIGVGGALRRKIEHVAKDIGYHANYFGQALRIGRSFTVGLLVGSTTRETVHGGLWGQLVEGVDSKVRAGGSDLLIIGPSDKETEIARSIRYLKQGRIDALIVPGLMYRGRLAQFNRQHFPIVVALPPEALALPCVRNDARSGLHQAVRHLATLGHRQIVWIDYHHNGAPSLPHRKAAVEETAAQCRVKTSIWHVDDEQISDQRTHECFIADCARQIAHRLAAARPAPTALICYNERVALGAYAALADKGLRIPRDVSVIGIDDIYADVAVPAMTVVSLKTKAVGEAAARLAMEMAANHGLVSTMKHHVEMITTDLVIRASTGPARSAHASA